MNASQAKDRQCLVEANEVPKQPDARAAPLRDEVLALLERQPMHAFAPCRKTPEVEQKSSDANAHTQVSRHTRVLIGDEVDDVRLDRWVFNAKRIYTQQVDDQRGAQRADGVAKVAESKHIVLIVRYWSLDYIGLGGSVSATRAMFRRLLVHHLAHHFDRSRSAVDPPKNGIWL